MKRTVGRNSENGEKQILLDFYDSVLKENQGLDATEAARFLSRVRVNSNAVFCAIQCQSQPKKDPVIEGGLLISLAMELLSLSNL